MRILSEKTALISGGGRGIGRATALLFAEHGADLILLSRTASELEPTAQLCREKGIIVFWADIDISDRRQVDNFFKSLPKNGINKIDILINNAACFDSGLMADYDLDRFDKILRCNLLAPFYLAQKVFPLMPKNQQSAVVNISSYSGCFNVEKFPGFGAYNISKYGLYGLTEILALEWKEFGIRVNQVSPSGVDTAMFKKAVPPGVVADLQPEHVARQILYLASEKSVPLNGENLMISDPSDIFDMD